MLRKTYSPKLYMKKKRFLAVTIWILLNLILGLFLSINLVGLVRVCAQGPYSLTVNTVGSGSVDLDPTGGVYDEGTEVTLTANPDSGWEFSGWSDDLSGTTNPESITMNSDKTVTATFTKIPPRNTVLTVIVMGSGSTTPSQGIQSYEKGTEVNVTATADAGWMFDHWILDSVNVGSDNPYTVIMDSDHSLTAVFSDVMPPTIEIDSPKAVTYSKTTVDLNFIVNEELFWVGYSLDGAANQTISGNTPLTGLSDGSHNIIVYANDTTGNMGKSNFVYFSVDTTPPTITILSPVSTNYYISQIFLEFSISEETTWVGYSLDEQNNITISGNTNIPVASEGTHKIVIYANDTIGNMGKSNTIYFNTYVPTPDTTPPTITITSPQETTYSTTEVALTFTIDEPVSWISYCLDDEDNVTITGNTTLSDFSEGEHTIKIFARDTTGNTGISNMATFKVDTTPPTITVTSPEETTYSTGNVFLEFTINEETTWISYSLDEADNVTITSDSVLSALSEGPHNIIVFATDYAGNTGASSTVQFTISITPVDTTLPTIKINSPQNSSYATPTVDLNFNINEQTSWIAYSLDGMDNVTISGNTTISGLSEGSHNIVVFAMDTTGNTGASSLVQFTISIPSNYTTPPIVVITSPESTNFSVSTVVLDFAINKEVTWIGYSLDGQDNVTITGDTLLSGLSEGSHSVVVFATDSVGNTGASSTIQFTISIPSDDTTPPTITINSPEDTTYEASDVPLDFSVNEDTFWIAFSLDGQNNITISEGIILSGLSEGSHSVVVFANDTAGNTGASNIVQFVVSITSDDTTPPTITINSPEDTTYNTNKITLTFIVNEEPTMKFYSLDGKANVTIVDSIVLSNLSDGEHSLIMYAEDSAGNIGVSALTIFMISTENEEPSQLWIVGVIAIVAFVGVLFSSYMAYDLFKGLRARIWKT